MSLSGPFPKSFRRSESGDSGADKSVTAATLDEEESDSQVASEDGDSSSCDSSYLSDSSSSYITDDDFNEVCDVESAAEHEPAKSAEDGLLTLDMIKALRVNTSEGNLFKADPAFENLVSKLVPRRCSDGGCQSTDVVYAVQTKSPMESLPGLKEEASTKPKDMFSRILESHGYTYEPKPYDSLTTWVKGCTASYNLTIMEAVRQGNLDTIRGMYRSGCNLQCCNKWGETILHAVARYGRLDILRFLVEVAGVSMRVCCDGGRTILHDACWTGTPHWNCIAYILLRIPEFLSISDKRGFTPLDYIPKDAWLDWNLFLENNQDLIISQCNEQVEI